MNDYMCCKKPKRHCVRTSASIASNNSALVCGYTVSCVSDAEIIAKVKFCDRCGNMIEKERECMSVSAGRCSETVTECFTIPCGATQAIIELELLANDMCYSKVKPIAYFC